MWIGMYVLCLLLLLEFVVVVPLDFPFKMAYIHKAPHWSLLLNLVMGLFVTVHLYIDRICICYFKTCKLVCFLFVCFYAKFVFFFCCFGHTRNWKVFGILYFIYSQMLLCPYPVSYIYILYSTVKIK